MATKHVGIIRGNANARGLNSCIGSAVFRGNAVDCKIEGPAARRRCL